MGMFADHDPPILYEGESYREDTRIPSFLTTHPDAEVQVMKPISPDLILGAWVERENLRDIVRAELSRLPGEDPTIHVEGFHQRLRNGFTAWG